MSLLAPEDPKPVAREIASGVYERLVDLAQHGTNLRALGPTGDVARAMVERLGTAKSPWADIVGPCYTGPAFQRELGISRQAVSQGVAALRYLRVTTSDGKMLYPAFQLRGGAVVPGLDKVLRILNEGTKGTWTWAQWLNTVIQDEDGYPLPRNIDRLAAGDIDGVLRDAQNVAAAWAA